MPLCLRPARSWPSTSGRESLAPRTLGPRSGGVRSSTEVTIRARTVIMTKTAMKTPRQFRWLGLDETSCTVNDIVCQTDCIRWDVGRYGGCLPRRRSCRGQTSRRLPAPGLLNSSTPHDTKQTITTYSLSTLYLLFHFNKEYSH